MGKSMGMKARLDACLALNGVNRGRMVEASDSDTEAATPPIQDVKAAIYPPEFDVPVPNRKPRGIAHE